MDFFTEATNIPLLLSLIFMWLWYVASPSSTYETTEMERVSTKKVFLNIAIILFVLWIVIKSI